MEVFGPVPSRRLGQSLGVNNIPPKFCSYSCIYCQLGRTNHMQAERTGFYRPEDIYDKTKAKMQELGKAGERVDYITFVADGEPILDKNLGREIELLRSLGTKIAVISNATLIWMDDVKEDLGKADWVSLKVDAVDRDIWRAVDRPHGKLEIERILSGIKDFADGYNGTLVTETMLVKGLNDSSDSISKTADYLTEIGPEKAYLLVPTRPPSETWVERPDMDSLKMAYAVMSQRLGTAVEVIGEDEGNSFFFTDNIADDILSIASVHPIREDVIDSLLNERGSSWGQIEELVQQGILERFEYENKRFYVRKVGERGD